MPLTTDTSYVLIISMSSTAILPAVLVKGLGNILYLALSRTTLIPNHKANTICSLFQIHLNETISHCLYHHCPDQSSFSLGGKIAMNKSGMVCMLPPTHCTVVTLVSPLVLLLRSCLWVCASAILVAYCSPSQRELH